MDQDEETDSKDVELVGLAVTGPSLEFQILPPDVSRVAYITNVNLSTACTSCKATQARFNSMDSGRTLAIQKI